MNQVCIICVCDFSWLRLLSVELVFILCLIFTAGFLLFTWFLSSLQVEEKWESQSYSVGLETERAALEEQLTQDTAVEEDKPEKVSKHPILQ